LRLRDDRVLWNQDKGPATQFTAVILFARVQVPVPLVPSGSTLRTDDILE
jgi:hypothetical protein